MVFYIDGTAGNLHRLSAEMLKKKMLIRTSQLGLQSDFQATDGLVPLLNMNAYFHLFFTSVVVVLAVNYSMHLPAVVHQCV